MPAVLILCSAMLPACTTMAPKDVTDPDDVTLVAAMEGVGDGFIALDKKLKEADKVLGVFPCRIVVSLNVKASANKTSKLVLGAAESKSAFTASAEHGGEAAAERGNTIKVELYSPACLPNNLIGQKDPEQIRRGIEAVKEGVELMWVPNPSVGEPSGQDLRDK